MTYRAILLASGTCAGLLIAAASLAMPIHTLLPEQASTIHLVDDDGSDGDDNRQELRRHHDDDENQASGHREDDDDDDDSEGSNTVLLPQSDTAPANGLFTPGAKPKVQLN